MTNKTIKVILICLILVLFGQSLFALSIKLGSLAPEGSPWDKALKKLAFEWKQASGGKVTLKIYAGGIAGDEVDMIRKIRINQLQAAAITGMGMGKIAWDTLIIQFPFMARTDDELNYLFEKMYPHFDSLMNEKGFKLLAFTQIGWAHFFTKKPVARPEDLRRLKFQVLRGSEEVDVAWKEMGFHIIPLNPSDVIPALQSGMVEALTTTPLTAAAMQWFALANNMTDLNWAPMAAGVVVSTRAWSRVPKDLQPTLLKVTQDIIGEVYAETVAVEEKAMQIMLENGLKITHVSPEAEAEWETLVERGFGILIGTTFSQTLYDEARMHLEDFRRQ